MTAIAASIAAVSAIGAGVLAGPQYLDKTYAPRVAFEIAQAQLADVYDARIKGIAKEIGQLEYKKARSGLTPIEQDRLQDLRAEYERVRQMQHGERK